MDLSEPFLRTYDKNQLEEVFKPGSVVDIMGSDRVGVIASKPRLMHPLKEQVCQGLTYHTNPPTSKGSSSIFCKYPNCDCPTKSDIDKSMGTWFIDVIIGTEKIPMSTGMLIVRDENLEE